MMDLNQYHWVSDSKGRLFLANAPDEHAPLRFNCYCEGHGGSRRLTSHEAGAIHQEALNCQMKPMTFVSSSQGVKFMQQLLQQQVDYSIAV